MVNKLLTFEQARKYLNIHKVTLYRLIKNGKIPASKVGKVWRFKSSKLDKWLDDQEISYNKR